MWEWMAWTLPVALFFGAVGLMLVGMTLWELRAPTTLRRGFLPLATTRGDRLFIGLLTAAYIHLAFVGLRLWAVDAWALAAEPSLGWASGVSLLVLLLIMRKG